MQCSLCAGPTAAQPHVWEPAGSRTSTRRCFAAECRPQPHVCGVSCQLFWWLPQQCCRERRDNGPYDSLDQLGSLRGRSLCWNAACHVLLTYSRCGYTWPHMDMLLLMQVLEQDDLAMQVSH